MRGNVDELTMTLESFDETMMSELVCTDCPALELPPAISRFESLMTLTIANSWIMSWSLNAALTEASFPALNSVELRSCDTNVTLSGLIEQPLSPSIEYIRFDKIAQTPQILDQVGTNWEHVLCFDYDSCNLTNVPPVVDTMYQLISLSLSYNDIRQLRDEWITRWNLELAIIWVDGNAHLATLSDVVWRQVAWCDAFSIQSTNISVIPSWVSGISHPVFNLYTHGTSLCVSQGRVSHVCLV